MKAHRVSWEIANGPIPVGLSVLHECDNPPCVRPSHLRLGTQRDNMADMTAKGRLVSNLPKRDQHGRQNRMAKLTERQVAEIRGLADAGYYQDRIAERYGISQSRVSAIASRSSWVGVEPVQFPPAVRDRPTGRSAKRKRQERDPQDDLPL